MNPLFIKNLSNIQRFLLILFAVVICMIYGIINEIILNWGNICAIAKKLWDFLGILGIFEISAVVFLIIVLFRFILKRIDLNRHLFGKSAWRPIIFSIFLIASVVLTISFTNRCVLHFCHYNLSEELIIKDIQLNNGTNIDNLYAILSQFMDPGNLPSASGKGRAFAIILALLGIILLSGLAVSTFINALGKKSDAWKKGMIHYGKSNLKKYKYTIIIGVDELTTAIVKQAIVSGADYVLIQTRQDVEKMRERLDLGLDKYDENKVVFYYGERTSEEDIKTLRPERCREVYILGEDLGCEDERDHDSYNIKCVELIAAILKKKSNKKRSRIQLRCHVNFEYQGTFTAFKATHHYSELQKSINFLPFNVHDLWAKKILVDNFAIIPGKNKGELEVQKYFPLDSYREDGQVKYITKDNKGDNDAKAVHLIIIGMNQMGTALGVQAALTAHYPNFKYDRTLRTTITYIDDHAKAEGEYLRGRYEALFCLCRHRTIVCDDIKQTGIDSASNWIDPLSQAKEIAGQKDNVQNERFRYLGNNTSENLDDCNFMDIQWEFIQGNVASKEIIDYLLAITADTHKTTTIAVCFNDPQKSIATALYLPGRVVRGANQLLVYQQNSFDLIDKVAKGENDWRRYKNMFPFGMTDGAYTGDEVENTIAKLQNYIFLKKDVARSDLRKFSSSIFYDINRSWDDLGMVLRQSNIDFAESVPSKLRSIRGKKYNGNPDNIELTNEIIFAMAESEHLRWVTQKLISGFRPLTEEEYKDFEIGKFDKEYYKRSKRAHLDICSYERLEKVDSKMPQNDKNTIKDLVLMLKATEWINRMEIKERSLASKFILGKNGMCFIESGKILYTLKPDNGLEERKSLELKHSRWMGATPVTKEQWYAVTGKNRPKRFKKKHPVVEVSKEDVDNFILILNKKTGLYFALPSIKEWEYVARHTDNKNNNKFGVQNLLGKVWQWTREEANGHEQCFYFCGGSTKFGENERDLENPIEY